MLLSFSRIITLQNLLFKSFGRSHLLSAWEVGLTPGTSLQPYPWAPFVVVQRHRLQRCCTDVIKVKEMV